MENWTFTIVGKTKMGTLLLYWERYTILTNVQFPVSQNLALFNLYRYIEPILVND